MGKLIFPEIKKNISRIITFALGLLVWSFLFLLFSIPLTLLILGKCFVLVLALIFRRDLYSISAGDAAFAIGCSWQKSKLSVGALFHIQGRLDLKEVQDRFVSVLLENKFNKYDKLSSCLVTFCGYLFRQQLPIEKVKVSINKLIYERKLGDGETLEEMADAWMEKQYEAFYPAWEVVVIPMETDETVLGFKIHHIFADGYSLLHLFDLLMGSEAPYIVKDKDHPFWKIAENAISLPVNLARDLIGPGSPRTNPLKLNKAQRKWVYTFTTLDLGVVKQIRRKLDVHFASIMIALAVGAMREFILERGLSLPTHFSTANTLPCERHPSRQRILCNHWTLGIIKSPIQEDNLLERVKETEKHFLHFQEWGLERTAVRILFPLAWLCPQFLAEKLMEEDRIGYNCGLTSLIGANKYEFFGKKVTSVKPLLTLVDSHPFTVFSWFTFSHRNQIDITLAAAPDFFQGPKGREDLIAVASKYFHQEYLKLCSQCGIILNPNGS